MSSDLSKALDAAIKRIMIPHTKMTLVEWADSKRYLSSESSSKVGRWKTSTVEVARGPMEAYTDPAVKKITIQSCTQLLKTEFLNNIVGFHIDQDPCPILLIQPDEDMAEEWGEERLSNMVRDTPCLAEKVAPKKSRDSGNTKGKKKFPGGYIAMIGARSPSKLASRPIRVVLGDEVDKYPASAGKEGDPLRLAEERSDTFWNAKNVSVCSPTIEGDSRINEEYKKSDQRVYEVPCPHCGEFQEMLFSSVSWPEGKPEEALYYCSHCGESWSELERIHSIQKGKWRATKPFKGHAGFKVSKLASPFKPMSVLAHKYEEAKGDPNMMKTFVNTQLAETYKETGEVPKWEGLYRRREKYPIGKVPAPGVVLLMGVDIQKDRIEFEVVAVCKNRRTYSIDYRVLDGDTARDEVWDKLESCIWETYQHESGKDLPIHKVAIDTGYRTTRVYQFCRKFSPNMVYPVKGSDNLMTPVGTQKSVDVNQHGKNLRRGLKLWHVGSSVLKNELYSMLQKEEPLDGESFPPRILSLP